MARALRLSFEVEGAFYHITARGMRKKISFIQIKINWSSI